MLTLRTYQTKVWTFGKSSICTLSYFNQQHKISIILPFIPVFDLERPKLEIKLFPVQMYWGGTYRTLSSRFYPDARCQNLVLTVFVTVNYCKWYIWFDLDMQPEAQLNLMAPWFLSQYSVRSKVRGNSTISVSRFVGWLKAWAKPFEIQIFQLWGTLFQISHKWLTFILFR